MGKSNSPAQLTLKEMRKRGYRAEVTERWIPGANIRKDLYGFVDVLCVGLGDTIAIQSTSLPNISTRCRKITEDCSEQLRDIRDSGWTVLVHGWKKNDDRNRWELTELDIS